MARSRNPIAARLDSWTSPLLLALVVLVLLSIPFPGLTIAAGAVTVLALFATLASSTSRTRGVSLLLIVIGAACLAIAWFVFGDPPKTSFLGQMNQDIIGLIASGALVRSTVTLPRSARPPRLSGRPAVVRTAFLTHFMSAVLNIVTVGIVGDRLKGDKTLSMSNATLLTQAFATASLWSPFWVVAAIVVSHAPNAPLLTLSAIGLGFAVVLVALASLWNASRRTPAELLDHGYALQPRLLMVPSFLIAVVLIGHLLLPETPVPRLVLLASACTLLIAMLRSSRSAAAVGQLARTSYTELRRSSNESALFISAGILTIGGSALIVHLPFSLAGLPTTVTIAWCFTLVMALLSLLGVHPIITISAAYAMGLVTPDGTLVYAAAMFWGWCIALPLGPLGGTLIYVSQRFGSSMSGLIRGSVPFTLLAVPLSWLGIATVALLEGGRLL